MGKQDRNQSDFFENPERFADLFNGCLFGGKNIIHPCELAEADSVFSFDTKQNPSGFVICDKAKKWRGVYFSVLILENQTFINYFMVIRSIKDEVAGYDRQRREGFERETGKGRKPDGNEFLSGMFKDQKFCPVITLILYIGTDKPWDAKTQLYDLLEIGEELKPFVTNYKLNLYDYHNHDDFSMFQTENRLLFEILSVSQDKNLMKELIQKRDLRHCRDREVVKAVLGCINIKFNLDKIYDSQKGEYDMCKAVDDLVMEGFMDGREEGQRIGREEGQRIGREEGKAEELMSNVTSLMDSLHLTLEEALSLLNVSDDRKSLLFYRK